jgi:hypothetical protein
MATRERIPIDQTLTEINFRLRNAELSKVTAHAVSGSNAITRLLCDELPNLEIRNMLRNGDMFLSDVFRDGHRFLEGVHPNDPEVLAYNPGEVYLRAAPTFEMRGTITQEQLDRIAQGFLDKAGLLRDFVTDLRHSQVVPEGLNLEYLLEEYRKLSLPYLNASIAAGSQMRTLTIPGFYLGRWVVPQ